MIIDNHFHRIISNFGYRLRALNNMPLDQLFWMQVHRCSIPFHIQLTGGQSSKGGGEWAAKQEPSNSETKTGEPIVTDSARPTLNRPITRHFNEKTPFVEQGTVEARSDCPALVSPLPPHYQLFFDGCSTTHHYNTWNLWSLSNVDCSTVLSLRHDWIPE